MNLVKLFGVSVIAIGLTACGGADNGSKEEKAAEAAPAVEAPAAEKAMEQASSAVEEAKEAVVEAVEEVKEAAPKPEPEKLEIPEGMVEGSVEHSIWLNNQGQ